MIGPALWAGPLKIFQKSFKKSVDRPDNL